MVLLSLDAVHTRPEPHSVSRTAAERVIENVHLLEQLLLAKWLGFWQQQCAITSAPAAATAVSFPAAATASAVFTDPAVLAVFTVSVVSTVSIVSLFQPSLTELY